MRLLRCCRRLCDLAAAACGTGRTRAAASALRSGLTKGRNPRVCPFLALAAKGKALFPPEPRRSLSPGDHAGSFSPFRGQDTLGRWLRWAPQAQRAALGTPRPRRLRAALPAAPGSAPGRQSEPRARGPPARRREPGALLRWTGRAVTLPAVKNNEV